MKDGIRQELSEQACKLLMELEYYQRAKTVMAYIPLPDELNIVPALRAAWQNGKTIVMPRIIWEKHELKPIVTHNLDSDLIAGRHGLREPAGEQEIGLEQIDLVIVPAVGFDRRGHRMGRGGGFYDRFLARPRLKARTIGITFDQQVLEELPVLSHDQRVQMVVTNAGVHKCEKDN